MSAMNADLNISMQLIRDFDVGALLSDREKLCMSVPFCVPISGKEYPRVLPSDN